MAQLACFSKRPCPCLAPGQQLRRYGFESDESWVAARRGGQEMPLISVKYPERGAETRGSTKFWTRYKAVKAAVKVQMSSRLDLKNAARSPWRWPLSWENSESLRADVRTGMSRAAYLWVVEARGRERSTMWCVVAVVHVYLLGLVGTFPRPGRWPTKMDRLGYSFF